jgi:hypothetical protein
LTEGSDRPAAVAITPVHVADLLAEDERMPVYVHGIDIPTPACWSTPAALVSGDALTSSRRKLTFGAGP